MTERVSDGAVGGVGVAVVDVEEDYDYYDEVDGGVYV